MMAKLATTPFHPRTAEHNGANAWVPWGLYTVPEHYGDWQSEALAARFSAVLADIMPLSDLRIHGSGAAALLSAACHEDLAALAAGHSRSVHWLADGGAVRGIGTVSRFGPDNFLMRAEETDTAWFAAAAPRFGAMLRDATAERALLWLAGPFAFAVLAAAELEEAARLQPGEHSIVHWHGVTVIIFRSHGRGEYQISCSNADAVAVIDRLMQAGRLFGLRLAGERARGVLLLESGIVVPGADFMPARSPFAGGPDPAALGVTPPAAEGFVLAGIELDSDAPAPFAAIRVGKIDVGRTMRSLYSPAARCALALASLASEYGAPGTEVRVLARGEEITGRVAPLPFLS